MLIIEEENAEREKRKFSLTELVDALNAEGPCIKNVHAWKQVSAK